MEGCSNGIVSHLYVGNSTMRPKLMISSHAQANPNETAGFSYNLMLDLRREIGKLKERSSTLSALIKFAAKVWNAAANGCEDIQNIRKIFGEIYLKNLMAVHEELCEEAHNQ